MKNLVKKENREETNLPMEITTHKEGDEISFIVTTNKEYYIKINPFSCSCADFRFRKEKTGEFCKHIQAVIQTLEETKPSNHTEGEE